MADDLLIVVPAAGSSSRLGEAKQEIPVHQTPLWQHTLSQLEPLAAPIVLVSGAWRPAQSELANYSVEHVHNPNWAEGMGSSIALAVQKHAAPRLGYLIVLVDQWGLDTAALQNFIAGWDGATPRWATDGAYTGPPALLPVAMRSALSRLRGDKGARQLRRQMSHDRMPVAHASWDLDTQEDRFLVQQLTAPQPLKETFDAQFESQRPHR